MSAPWSDEENDAIVADYFAMLAEELAGRVYNKAAHNRDLQRKIARAKGSIEFKHQNISAVLKGVGEAWINGYKPAFNFQASLVDAVGRWLTLNGDVAAQVIAASQLEDIGSLYIDPPPTLRNLPPPDELEQMLRIAHKFDAAGRDERNRTLGRAGEERVLVHERAALTSAGRSDLASKVVWTSQTEGDGAGYDIASFEPSGERRLIEVKTTKGWERTPFYISRNELAVSENRRAEWCLIRLWNFAREPRAFELRPPLESHVSLTATNFEAKFDGRNSV